MATDILETTRTRAPRFEELGLSEYAAQWLSMVWANFKDPKFEEMLQYLHVFQPQISDSHFRTPKSCYENAVKSVQLKPGSRLYVEGWATYSIPISHAWFTEDMHHAQDPTWQAVSEEHRKKDNEPLQASDIGADYAGFVFRSDRLPEALDRCQVYGFLESAISIDLFNNPHDWLIPRQA